MSPPRTALSYRLLASAAVPLMSMVLRDRRSRAAHAARLAAPESVSRWARAHRDPTRPLAWFHASSVGEGLQARTVLTALRTMLPALQFVYTHFSPSADEFATTVGADWSGYLGYDRAHDMERMLAAAAPDLLVFAKLDLWPELATRAASRGVPVAMVAATVGPESSRRRWPVRALARPGYSALALAAAVSTDDATRLAELGCSQDRIVVTGDPRVDSVLDVVEGARRGGPVIPVATHRTGRVLVAGSTWPRDEGVVLAAFARVREQYPDARLVLVPHQPTPEHLEGIERVALGLGEARPVRLGAWTPGDLPPVLVVDRTGLLARLYSGATLAYVGGGFGGKGIHSVFEPAAWGVPVIIGPHDRGSGDAALLERAGAIERLPASDPVAALTSSWCSALADSATAAARGTRGRAALEAARGAADRTATLLAALIRSR